jgi:hypothetical protein
MLRKSISVLALVATAAACSAANEPLDPPSEGVNETTEEVAGDTFTYYIVTRQDLRKCAYPMCGGWFVKRVNRALTKCADGKWNKDCHMVDLDLSALGVSDETASEFRNGSFGMGHGLVRGTLQKVGMADTLIASEAWVGAADSKPVGTTYRVTSSGIQCITYPCPSFEERKLNAYSHRKIHDVDLWVPGATDAEVDAGYQHVAGKGALVAGTHYLFWGPAGMGRQLYASEFYLPLQDKKSAYCGTTTIPGASPTFYAKNFGSKSEASDWLSTYFPNGENTQIWEGSCDQPKACIKIYKPVCGVVKYYEPNTYGNSCEFEAAVMGDAGAEGESKGYYSEGACEAPTCDYNDPNKSYVAQSPEQCQLVKFFCEEGKQPFFDECGCGCELGDEPVPPKGEPCGDTTCTDGMVCCNASCGICTQPGMMCTQQACN